jgi:hypothetical protein
MFYREMIDIDCENYEKDMTYEEIQVFNKLNVMIHIIITKQLILEGVECNAKNSRQ